MLQGTGSQNLRRRAARSAPGAGHRLSAVVARSEYPDRERKRVIRLLIEDATLLRDRSWARPVYVAVHNRAAEIVFQDWENVLEVAPEKISVIGSILNRLGAANLAKQRFDSQNVNVSSSAIMMTGGPPDEIFTALAKVCLPPADSAHFWSASMDGKCTSATR